MDNELLRQQIEKVFSRQSGLSDTKKQMIKEKLDSLDWDKFKEAALARYYEAIEKADTTVSPDLANSLLMEAIRLEIESSFGKPGVGS